MVEGDFSDHFELREATRLFEELHKPALQAREAIRYLSDHPFCPEEELAPASGIKYNRQGLTELTALKNVMLAGRRRVRKVREAMQSQPGEIQYRLAERAYRSMAHHGPSGHVGLSYLNNPFAICMSMDSADLKGIYPRDAAGFFDKNETVRINGKEFNFPLIGVARDGGIPEPLVLTHELQHAYNNLVKKALSLSRKNDVWGESFSDFHLACNGVPRLRSLWPSLINRIAGNLKEFTQSEEYSDVIEYMLQRSKDEIIVRLATREGFGGVFTKNSLYDMTLSLGFPKRDSCGNFVWNQWRAIAEPQADFARGIVETYSFWGLNERAQIVPWMLMRVPIQRWYDTLIKCGIAQEINILKRIGILLVLSNQVSGSPSPRDKYQTARKDVDTQSHPATRELQSLYQSMLGMRLVEVY